MLAAGLNLHAYSYPPPKYIRAGPPCNIALPPPVPRTFEDAALAMLRLSDVVRDSSATVIVAPENWLGTLPLAGMRRLREALTPDQRLLVGGISSQDGVLRKGVWDLPRGAFTPAIAPIPLIEAYPADYARAGQCHRRSRSAGQPVGLLRSQHIPPALSPPLWHAGDSGCQRLVGHARRALHSAVGREIVGAVIRESTFTQRSIALMIGTIESAAFFRRT
ncbi:hypothetical protein [Cupriavidus basilensis]